MVVRDNPVASATSEIPPRPRLWASAAAQRRRIRSSMIGDRAWNFAWIFATVVCVFIRTTYGQGNHCPVHFASAPNGEKIRELEGIDPIAHFSPDSRRLFSVTSI